jgi:hypothetical protein
VQVSLKLSSAGLCALAAITRYLWHHDVNFFDSCTTAPILASDYDGVAATLHRSREIPEMPVRAYIGYLFAIDD